MAKNAFNLGKQLLSKSLNKDIKNRIIKAIVWSVALYAAEPWTYRKEDIRRLEAFEMWVWSRMEKVSWRDMKTIGTRKKKPYGYDLEKEENWIGHLFLNIIGLFGRKLDQPYTQR